jgi:hypothetical protein
MTERRKNILFVEDGANLLDSVRQLMARFAGSTWDINPAQDVSLAMARLQQQRVDLLVIQREAAHAPDGSTAA